MLVNNEENLLILVHHAKLVTSGRFSSLYSSDTGQANRSQWGSPSYFCYNKTETAETMTNPMMIFKQWGVEKHLWWLLVWIVSRLGQLNTPFSSWKNVGRTQSAFLALFQHNQISQSQNHTTATLNTRNKSTLRLSLINDVKYSMAIR